MRVCMRGCKIRYFPTAGFAHAFANVVFSACAGISYSVDISRLYGWRQGC